MHLFGVNVGLYMGCEHVLQDVEGMSVVIFLNNLTPFEVDGFFNGVDFSFATGALVSVHAPDTLPDMTKAVAISHGVQTTLHVNPIRRMRLKEPWAHCTGRRYVHDPDVYYKHRRMRYTTDSCFNLCGQAQVGTNLDRLLGVI